MPVHDWTRVEAGIFHDFHHSWIDELKRSLNSGLLPEGYYALAEQRAAGFGPDVLTLDAQDDEWEAEAEGSGAPTGAGPLLLAPPRVRITAETEMAFYRRKQNAVVVRHISGDRMVAVIEVVSPGNKSGRPSMQAFVEKAADLLNRGIHLLILDLHPPGPRDPQGIHGLIWEDICGEKYAAPADKPLTLAAYESSIVIRAFVEPLAVGDRLTDMPLFLKPGGHVLVPLESTYEGAFAALPARWRKVLER